MIFKKILVIFYDFFKYFKGNLNNFLVIFGYQKWWILIKSMYFHKAG